MEKPSKRRQEILLVSLILMLALAHGIIYIFLIPPWQHYDEPKHFEYVWLNTQDDPKIKAETYSPKFSRQVLKSMVANGFYHQKSEIPVVGPPSEKIRIPGYSQLTEPVFYYRLASLPLKLFTARSVEVQLYITRMVSIIFLLITVLAGYGIAAEMSPPGHPLRWMLPMTAALTPAFVDLMSAVNNDAAAIGVTSVYLWLSVRIIRRGFSWGNFIGLIIVGLLTYFIKFTAMMALTVFPLVILFSLLQGKMRKFVWGVLFIILSFSIIFSLRWDDVFAWYRNSAQIDSMRLLNEKAVLGNYVISIQSGSPVTPPGYPEVYQHIPIKISKSLAGKPVTFGFWIWSDRPQLVRSPIIKIAGDAFSQEVEVTTEPTFHALQVFFPEDTSRIWIYLSPVAEFPGSMVYYDGMVLAEGYRLPLDPPEFIDSSGDQGYWGGEPFTNYLRNGSAESAGPRMSPWLDEFAVRLLPDGARPSVLIASLVDDEGSRDLYPISAVHIFQTFWARFGWGNVPLLTGEQSYWILAVFSLFGILGFVMNILHKKRMIGLDLAVIFCLLILQYLMMTITRGGMYLAVPGFYIPVARHYYPVILPTLTIIIIGWLELFRKARWISMKLMKKDYLNMINPMEDTVDPWMGNHYIFYILFFLILDVISILGILRYFDSQI